MAAVTMEPAVAPVEPWMIRDLRRLAAVATAGLVLGFTINGWGSRLAMLVLARLNPQATGRLSDDGFVMGRFELAATMNLVVFGALVGVLGGVIFLAVSHLRFGPAWFRLTSMTVGPAVVVGSMLVHTDGIDFVLLQPAWLAIALFVALPGVFAGAMMWLGDRWLREDSWFMGGSRWRLVALAPLVGLVPLAPFVLVLGLARTLYHQSPRLRTERVRQVGRFAARLALVVIFAVALFDLVQDTARLV